MAYCGDPCATGFGGGGACGPAGFGGCGPVGFDACAPAMCAPQMACAPAPMAVPVPVPVPTMAAPVAHTAVEAWGRPVWKKNWLFGRWKYAGLKNVQYIPRTHVEGMGMGCGPGMMGGACGPMGGAGPMGFGGTCAPYC